MLDTLEECVQPPVSWDRRHFCSCLTASGSTMLGGPLVGVNFNPNSLSVMKCFIRSAFSGLVKRYVPDFLSDDIEGW